ncbi:unknown [Choristoneura fumiferana multiple nucleopolyhedrovirus]|uniref:Uncharacterized protein n=1 Tax=Choristoneura fumiferana nuclear polyhedrosis virus TaxID=208973 RepID=Q7TLV3_NPVCF|nr:unknown [Choristoneura fumiferana multiple nucleopolyhedrovirus]AAP29825.1 unknown [Choristoneura fumiferana multiple nucleopolyhedrovirus]
MFCVKGDGERPLSQQLDHINMTKRKITVESQHFEKLFKVTKNTSELRDLQKRVMDSRQKFLNFGVKHF